MFEVGKLNENGESTCLGCFGIVTHSFYSEFAVENSKVQMATD